MDSVKVVAPAKLNLALAIKGVLPNGYHSVDMLMQAVSIFEEIEITKAATHCLKILNSTVPANANNTATKAANLFFEKTGIGTAAKIIINKKIPVCAGMAGGSADAAGVLVGLNQLYAAGLSALQLCSLGGQIGADVPFSIIGGTARAQGTGKQITPLPPLPACWFVVLMPFGRGNPTAQAYRLFDEKGSSVQPNLNSAEEAIRKASLPQLFLNMQNMLEDTSGGERTVLLRAKLAGLGAKASMMTGSGSAVFGVFETEDAAENAAKKLKDAVAKVFVCRPLKHGAIVLGGKSPEAGLRCV